MNNQDIVNRIFDTMKKKKVTQNNIAEKLGIGQSTVANWKSRNCPPPVEQLCQIAKILDVSVSYLVGEETNQQHLNQEEKLLIKYYRNITPEQQKLVIGSAEQHYKNRPTGLSFESKII